MADWKSCFVTPPADGEAIPPELLDKAVAHYPWFVPARILRERTRGKADPQVALLAPWRVEGPLRMPPVDASALGCMRSSSEQIIDRFLQEEDLRIVAQEGEPECEVRTRPELDEADEVVSEELARIYLAQGLDRQAAAIYRKLSLLNPEKSVYFAELIDRLESGPDNN